MLSVSSEDRKALRQALVSGYRRYSTLKIFVSDHFDHLRLNQIASSQATKVAADDLIEHFEEGGDITELILALAKDRPNNPDVQILMGRLQGFLQQRWLLDPDLPATEEQPFDLPEDYDDLQLESLIPRPLSYETHVQTLRQGLKLADAVCKVSFTDRGTTGTGVLVAPDLVLTNYHVLTRERLDAPQLQERARTAQFEFELVSQEDNQNSTILAVNTSSPLMAHSPIAKLDYALLRVEPKIASIEVQPVQITHPGPLITRGGELNVLHHPQGKSMEVSLSASGVVQTDNTQNRIWYVNRTHDGSSGAPCFTRDWQFVALHHARMSRGFGSVREGILMSSIMDEISGFLS